MKKIIVLLMIFLFIRISQSTAQNLVLNSDFHGFTAACGSTTGAFASGCFPGWSTSHGTPDIYWTGDNPYTIPGGNTNYFAGYGSDLQYSQSEGIYYSGIIFYPSYQYTLSFKVKGPGAAAVIKLANGLVPVNNNSITLPPTVPSQTIASDNFNAVTTWQTVSYTFQPNNVYNQLWFYDYGGGFVYLDDVSVTRNNITVTNSNVCCTPYITYSSTSSLPPFTSKSVYINTSSSVVVTSAQNVVFQAGQYIELNPGFETQTNGVFAALIGPCLTSLPVVNAGPDVHDGCNLEYFCWTIGEPSVPGETYLWTSSTPNGTSLISSITSSSNSLCRPLPLGTINFTLTATNACGSSSDQMTLIKTNNCGRVGNPDDSNNAPEQSEENNKFGYYPNPTNGKIKLNIPTEAASVNISISDLKGMKIYESNLSGSQEIDLSGRESGIYILRTNIDGNIKTQKIILNK